MISARAILIVISMILLHISAARGQFSPGELSRAHEQLEGMQNCGKCHEVGKEISGEKCLTCHTEIKAGLDAKHGYHYAVASQKCVACHKEHLGRDARTVLFDKRTFDHSLTGFQRTGKHASVQCEACHAQKNIKSPEVVTLIAQHRRATYLGLSTRCVDCHEDRHRGTVSVECQSCHTTSAWSPASKFDHAKTKFPLAGKHATTQCIMCHGGSSPSGKDRLLILSTKSFQDCAPCHSSPHKLKFEGQSCTSCHTPDDWHVMKSKKFDHNLTSFRLQGKHATLRCEQCHGTTHKRPSASAVKTTRTKCIDCHVDHHKGEFSGTYGNDCLRCHTQDSFTPTTFSFAAHQQTRFPLNGAHSAVPCSRCHGVAASGFVSYRFASLQCVTCHKDAHARQFADASGEANCVSCHSSDSWKIQNFEHAKTRYPLIGRHAVAKCEACHKRALINGQEVVQYRGLSSECRACHKEVHAGQFAVNGETNCQACHTPQSWTQLSFDHNVQSRFVLTGAHKKVACRACHREERSTGITFVRFKPMSQKCETCHS